MSLPTTPYDDDASLFGILKWDRRYDAVWRTFVANHDMNTRQFPSASFANSYEAFKRIKDPLVQWAPETSTDNKYRPALAFAKSRRELLRGRAVFTTKTGYTCLGPARTVEGDLVCVLRGGNVPFVLRRIGDEFREFIGAAYVHGVMQGETVRRAKPGDVHEFWLV